MQGRSRIIFDTSGLNALADDPDSALIVRSLGVGFRVLLSETSICEVVGTSKPERRALLLDLCTHLVHAGEGMFPFHEIHRLMSRAHSANPASFDWLRIDVRWPELEEELARRTFITDAELARDVKADNKALNKQFAVMWRDARAQFEPELSKDGEEAISVTSVFETLEADGSPLWQLAADIYKANTGRELSRNEAKAFVDSCPPAKALLLAGCIGQYHWGLKDAREETRFKAGRLDLFSATYLPFCDRFITNDLGQCNALKLAAERAGLATEVCTYAEFRRRFLIAA
jgi:hypothetical protein